jgi:hypothetical protein
MRFSGFSKLALLLPPAAILLAALVGCGSGNNLALTQGNWAIAATSTGSAPTHNMQVRNQAIPNVSGVSFYVGGNLTQNGGNLSGTMYVTGSCLDPSAQIAFTGTVKGTKVTLTSASTEGEVITVVATGASLSSTSSLTGTYSVKGGCDDGDSGTVAANAVPSIDGTWAGTLSNSGCADGRGGCVNATISITLTEATTASADGTFALSGTVTYTNSVCSVSGTVTGGFVSGQFVKIDASTIDQSENTGAFEYGLALLDSPTIPANMTSGYTVDDGDCAGDVQTLSLAKQ